MKTLRFITAALLTIITPLLTRAQNPDAKTLVEQGVALNDSGKYDEAIAKYNAAIKLDSTYANAYYEIGYTLFSSGNETEAIPYLQKVLALQPKSAGAYDMLGSIYDDQKEPDKALENYKKGLEIDPGYQRLHYNMAITYYRIGQYAESETSAIAAIKLDPRHASSQRILAMATYAEKKRGSSLMAWCSFLLLEPQSQRSPEAFGYVLNILNYGISKKDDKHINLTISPNGDPSEMMMPIAVLAATENKTGLTAIDSVQLQLTSVFQIAHTITDTTQTFLAHYYADYFQKLAESGNMAAFTRFISLSAYHDENLAWFKEHDQELAALDKWMQETQRSF